MPISCLLDLLLDTKLQTDTMNRRKGGIEKTGENDNQVETSALFRDQVGVPVPNSDTRWGAQCQCLIRIQSCQEQSNQ